MLSSSSMSSSRFCFNHECSEFKLQHCRPGWRIRTGDFVDLCDRCASVYEQGKFCDVFHLKASGWRCCESCGKRVHCGCIVSASAYMLLDAGGIECLACARKKLALGPNFSPSPSFLFQSPISEKFKDLSLNWSSSTRSNQMSFQPPSCSGPSFLQFDLRKRGDNNEFSQPTSKERAAACSMERKRGLNNMIGKLVSENSKNYEVSPFTNGTNVNVYHPLISIKEGSCGTQFAFPVPITTPIERTGHSRLGGSHLWHTANCSPLSRLHNDLNGGADSPFECKSRNVRTHFDTPGTYQVVPQYWPKVSYINQVLQNQSKESESVVTHLFEKMLSASDTGRVGRMVLPKKCAEAFLPQISNPEGVPLKILDPMGKEWIFHFRFWATNKSRIYVLEGVGPCIQSLQLQTGDTVIFNRLDPERKLMLGFRKASVAQSSDQETDSTNNNRDTCTNRDQAEPADMHSLSKVKKPAYITKETPGVEISSSKKKSSMMNTRGKRRKVEKGDHIELQLTWEEAQGFLLPPPNFTPSKVVIEDSEFEEYEDAPIIGKPIDDTSFRSTCTPDQKPVAEQQDEETMEDVEGLLMSPKTTKKHPRHRNDCTCIVCIQSPSGAGTKHDRCCSCAVCEAGKSRRRSLLLRREKKQMGKEDDPHKELEQPNSDNELCQSGNNSENHESLPSPVKGQLDLNFKPEKDGESLPGSNKATKKKTLHHDDTVKSSFKSPSSSTAHSQINKEEEETADTTTSSI
ncbi:PREDICTED: B3 domain-containing transcription factor VAL3-like isoform X1 [Camelina sativa]|uniref:B3 domain-containing transcription factor VAL3-like isoform X1 n=1 Tax=Camelina sativa TaxID=90675 RepID=A0ABM0U0R6_CAMSA|nr:PREDICTED: B3 domain-containing transcription factor VAL3-like isoform X1 [Camelina sativa]